MHRNIYIGILIGFTLSNFFNLLLLHAGVEEVELDFGEPVHAPDDFRFRNLLINNEPKNFTWSILTTFLPSKAYPERYKLGFTTWMTLSPKPELVFLSDGTELDILHEMAVEFNASIYPVKTNLRGTPLQDDMFITGARMKTDISVVINSDILLLPSFIEALNFVRLRYPRFLMSGARWDLDVLPVTVGSSNWAEFLTEYTREHGVLHTYGGLDYYAYPTGGNPYKAVTGCLVPPFAYGRSKADNWVIHMATETKQSIQVVDASEVAHAIHIRHDYQHLTSETAAPTASQRDIKQASANNFWSSNKDLIEPKFNRHLAYYYGNYTNQQGTPFTIPLKLSRCEIPESNTTTLCGIKRRRAICSCEQSNFVVQSQMDPKLNKNKWECGSLGQDKKDDYAMDEEMFFEMLHHRAENRTVVLLGVNGGYVKMLENMVCRLQELGINNYLVAAFDKESYEYCLSNVIPSIIAYNHTLSISSAADFGSKEFRALTKLKSLQVLRILKAGFNVLWSDVDIFFKKDPILHLQSLKYDLSIQSNAPVVEWPDSNGYRRINSGFYFVRSTPETVAAFQGIVDHAKFTKLSEQPSFYTVLCGDDMKYVLGRHGCYNYELNVHTHFLDRSEFPNGAIYWRNMTEPLSSKYDTSDSFIVHANWMKGHDIKVQRLREDGSWILDEQNKCRYK